MRPTKEEIAAAAKRLGMRPSGIEARYARGWSWEDAMTKKRRNGGKASRQVNPGFGDNFNYYRRSKSV